MEKSVRKRENAKLVSILYLIFLYFCEKELENRDLVILLDRLNLSNSGAVFFFEENGWKDSVPKETIGRLNTINPAAVYLFNNHPYILFFDLTGPSYHKEREKQIHKQVWSLDQSPIIFILKDGDVEVYNAFSYEKAREKLEKIDIEDRDIDKQFSFWNLQSGNTWNWLKEEYYKNTIKQKRVSQKLFDNIKFVREKLIDKNAQQHLSDDEANTLILRLIFIRYLIDRDVKLNKEFIQGDTIIEKRVSFIQLVSNPVLLNKFFYELNEKFNGVLFKNIQFELFEEQANALAGVFSGEIAEKGTLFYGSDFFFEIFDFSIIPVELISGIYESLIDPDTRILHSAVYTPPFLVEYMLADTLDEFFRQTENVRKTECKVFDPSVGSGIFLVQSFRRMVDREMDKEKKISRVRLREIVEKNLYGIDINEQALKVTCFSIYIAMLDYQDPKTLLGNFHFPTLIGQNLFVADFFDSTHSYNDKIRSEKIDFILGNPPWKSDKNDYHLQWLKKNKKVTGRFEIAQSFLLRSKDFMHFKTISGLIVTSTIFYNISPTTKKFKTEFLANFCIGKFLDLSPVRRLIFEEKNSPCAIVYYHLSDGKSHLKNIVRHQSVKSNIFLKYFKALVIEKFDQKQILQTHFIENDWMFKVALYGNTLDFLLLKKIQKTKLKIQDIIDNKMAFKGAGVKSNKGADYADFLIGLPMVENQFIRDYYTKIDEDLKILTDQDVYFERGRTKELFFGEKILIKEQARNESELVISYVQGDCAFKNGTWGITSENSEFIKKLYTFLISDLYSYFIFITSCSWGVSTRPQIRLDDEYLSFPFIEPSGEAADNLVKLAENFLRPFKKHNKRFNLGMPEKNTSVIGEVNFAIERIYAISGYEKDLIAYVLDVSRYQFQESKLDRITRKIHTDEAAIEQYSDVFIEEFKYIYPNEYLRIDVYPIEYFIALNFVFQADKPKKKVNFVLDITEEKMIFKALSDNFSISSAAKNLYIQKDIKGFEENSFYIIKPNEYKCWHRAMAWYDVAEIKEAIEVSEIDYLKKDWNAS